MADQLEAVTAEFVQKVRDIVTAQVLARLREIAGTADTASVAVSTQPAAKAAKARRPVQYPCPVTGKLNANRGRAYLSPEAASKEAVVKWRGWIHWSPEQQAAAGALPEVVACVKRMQARKARQARQQ